MEPKPPTPAPVKTMNRARTTIAPPTSWRMAPSSHTTKLTYTPPIPHHPCHHTTPTPTTHHPTSSAQPANPRAPLTLEQKPAAKIGPDLAAQNRVWAGRGQHHRTKLLVSSPGGPETTLVVKLSKIVKTEIPYCDEGRTRRGERWRTY